jgi:hypothetical protein
MTNDVLIAVLAACVGVAVGVLVVLRRQPQHDDTEALDALNAVNAVNAVNAQLHAELTARLEVQAAELRRMADASGQRDASTEHLRTGLEATRQVLE